MTGVLDEAGFQAWQNETYDMLRQAYTQAADAYRELRRAQHRARLDEQPTLFPPDTLVAERAAGRALWQAVFGA